MRSGASLIWSRKQLKAEHETADERCRLLTAIHRNRASPRRLLESGTVFPFQRNLNRQLGKVTNAQLSAIPISCLPRVAGASDTYSA
jgi:hypothetical protein